jgi:hypothetical protein
VIRYTEDGKIDIFVNLPDIPVGKAFPQFGASAENKTVAKAANYTLPFRRITR